MANKEKLNIIAKHRMTNFGYAIYTKINNKTRTIRRKIHFPNMPTGLIRTRVDIFNRLKSMNEK